MATLIPLLMQGAGSATGNKTLGRVGQGLGLASGIGGGLSSLLGSGAKAGAGGLMSGMDAAAGMHEPAVSGAGLLGAPTASTLPPSMSPTMGLGKSGLNPGDISGATGGLESARSASPLGGAGKLDPVAKNPVMGGFDKIKEYLSQKDKGELAKDVGGGVGAIGDMLGGGQQRQPMMGGARIQGRSPIGTLGPNPMATPASHRRMSAPLPHDPRAQRSTRLNLMKMLFGGR
jgi:hypothetical protein